MRKENKPNTLKTGIKVLISALFAYWVTSLIGSKTEADSNNQTLNKTSNLNKQPQESLFLVCDNNMWHGEGANYLKKEGFNFDTIECDEYKYLNNLASNFDLDDQVIVSGSNPDTSKEIAINSLVNYLGKNNISFNKLPFLINLSDIFVFKLQGKTIIFIANTEFEGAERYGFPSSKNNLKQQFLKHTKYSEDEKLSVVELDKNLQSPSCYDLDIFLNGASFKDANVLFFYDGCVDKIKIDENQVNLEGFKLWLKNANVNLLPLSKKDALQNLATNFVVIGKDGDEKNPRNRKQILFPCTTSPELKLNLKNFNIPNIMPEKAQGCVLGSVVDGVGAGIKCMTTNAALAKNSKKDRKAEGKTSAKTTI